MHPTLVPFLRPAALAATAALLLLALAPAHAPAAGKKLSNEEVQEFNEAAGDSSRAEWAMARLRHFLRSDPDSAYAFFARRMIVKALFTTGAPGRTITASVDTCASLLPRDPRMTVFFWAEIAQMLLDRETEYERALEYSRRALADVPGEEQFAPLRAAVLAVKGRAQTMTGFPDSAVASLLGAMPFAPDSQQTLYRLGQAYEKTKKSDQAINAYLRSLAVYLGKDTAAAAPLRALWKKKRGSLEGLDARVAEMQSVSRKKIALDARKENRPAPAWTLKDLDGKPVSSDDFRGKVVVLDFWGSWCGPCRIELPIFQAMYERYKDRGIVFLGMNYERPVPGKDLKRLARDFMEKHKYTFPVIVDHDHVAADAFKVEGYPTVYLVDKAGVIRYKNVGVSEGIETILEDQLESLIR